MKKVLLVLMVVLSTFTIACASDDRTITIKPGDFQPLPSDPIEIGPVKTIDWARKSIKTNENTAGIKILGERHLKSNKCIYMDYSCSGVEFNAYCKTRLGFSVTVDDDCMFKVYIDGQLYDNDGSDYFKVAKGETATLVVKVTKGKHNVKLVKVSHYRMAKAQLNHIIIYGQIIASKPKNKSTYIEFIGDSITCGWGVVGSQNGDYTACDGTLAYPYLVSQALDADYSIFGMSGQGAYYGNPSVQNCYLKTSYDRSNEAYDFARKADAVVINIGTNDATYKTGTTKFKAALLNIIKYVRQKHGSDVKILIVYNMKNDGYSSVLTSVAKSEGISIMKCARSTNKKALYHPSIAEHAKYATQITKKLSELLGK